MADRGAKPRVCFEFDVEKIIGVSNDGRYQVQWLPAWVDKSLLIDCDHLIHKFLQEEGEKVQKAQDVAAQQSKLGGDIIEEFSQQRTEAEGHVKPEDELNKPYAAIKREDVPIESYELTLIPPTPSEGVDETHMATDNCAGINKPMEIFPVLDTDDEQQISSTSKISTEFAGLDKAMKMAQEDVRICFSSRTNTTKTLFSAQANSTLTAQMDSTSTGKAVCNVCDKQFVNLSQLGRHLRTHTGHKSFECPQCPKKFSQRQHLTRHILIHTGERPYSCNYCSYSCIQKIQLTLHVRTKHTGEKPYSCTVCGKSFAGISEKNQHMQLCSKKMKLVQMSKDHLS